MKFQKLPIAFFLLTFIFSLLSCKENSEDVFLKRNVEELSFDYAESSKEFTVRSNGKWSIEVPSEYSSWIKVEPSSGIGDGSAYQKVIVTCNRNTAEVREGAIYLNGAAQPEVPVKIIQNNGLFEWKTYSNGNHAELQNPLIVGQASTSTINIPYIKAVGNESFPVTVTLSGKGASGLSVGTTTIAISEEGDGFIRIPVSGTPNTQGYVQVNVKVNNQDFGQINTISAVGNTIIEQRFNKFIWGGDCIGNKEGVTTTKATAEMSLSDETKICAIGDNGANGSGVTSTIRNSNTSFYKEIEMENWFGLRNYMRTGYIQLGAASSTASEFGSLISPALALPIGSTQDLLVTFRAAIYNNPAPESILVGLVPKNTDGIKTTNISVISNKESLPINIMHQTWVNITCVVKNATNTSSLVISLPEELNQGGAVQAGRLYIDDIVVTY